MATSSDPLPILKFTTAMATYPYRPLNLPNQTRILTISPGGYEDPLICTLTHLPLSSTTPPYEALSYCWSKSTTQEPPDLSTEVGFAVYDPEGDKTESTTGKIHELLGHPVFQNLYYQTGGVRLDGKITCDGVEMSIAGELYAALKRLRKTEVELRIWVDALCINQSDVAERNEHVKMMGDIYAKAEGVKVWLGEEVGMQEMAMRVLDGVNQKFDELFGGGWDGDRGRVQYNFINDERMTALDWDALAELLNRAWFERVWVIQELANAKQASIHIGRTTMGWDYFAAIISTMRQFNVDANLLQCSSAIKSICMMNMLREIQMDQTQETRRMPLLELLEETRDFKSTLPSDKIYGILGLAKDREDVDVDYAIGGEEVFRKLVATCLIKGGSLDILYHCVYPSTPSKLELPSWVPDWTTRGHVELFPARGLKASATGSAKPKLRIDENGKTLNITGKVVDKIAVIEESKDIPSLTVNKAKEVEEHGYQNAEDRTTRRINKFQEQARIWCQNSLDIAFAALPNIVTTSESKEMFWRTFMCNRTRDNRVPDGSCGVGFEIFMEGVMSGRTPTSVLREMKEDPAKDWTGAFASIEDGGLDVALSEFLGAHSKWCYNRRFFKSESGRFGWIVDGSQVGDEICVLYGGDYPFVMRPDGAGGHRIIGDCYIHGLMDGEAMDPSFPEVEFRIE